MSEADSCGSSLQLVPGDPAPRLPGLGLPRAEGTGRGRGGAWGRSSYLGHLPGPPCGHPGGPGPRLHLRPASHLHRPWISNRITVFSEFGQKSCLFFFQIVWAWQVPNDTVPKAPSSYNLKEKKKQDTKPRRVSRESGPCAAASAASSKSQCAASQSGPNGLTEACPAFCNFLFCFIFNLSMRCCLPRELGAGQAAGGQVSPAKNPLPQAARRQGRYPGAVGTVGTACEGAGVGAAVPALLVHLRGQGPSHASRAPPRARTDTDWPHPAGPTGPPWALPRKGGAALRGGVGGVKALASRLIVDICLTLGGRGCPPGKQRPEDSLRGDEAPVG